jgi:lipopolysaccharide export system protein LptA
MKGRPLAAALLAALAVGGAAHAQKKADSPLLPGGNPHAPVNISADRLEYFSKEAKAVYSGHVIAHQGDGVLRASSLSIFFAGSSQSSSSEAAASAGMAGSEIDRMAATGPVTIIQKDQVGVGDRATYERASNEVILVGDVSLTQGPDVVRGDRLIYDLNTGQAQVVGRVTSLFVPGSGGPAFAKPTRSDRKRMRPAASQPPRF